MRIRGLGRVPREPEGSEECQENPKSRKNAKRIRGSDSVAVFPWPGRGRCAVISAVTCNSEVREVKEAE